MSDPQTIRDEDMKRIQAALDLLSEHFDTVQVFCTRHEAGRLEGTVTADMGTGNWYARYGQVRAWLLHQDAMSAAQEPCA